jgi:hypothetical protein
MKRSAAGVLVIAAVLLAAATATAQQPEAYFRQESKSCHTLGNGRLTGLRCCFCYSAGCSIWM